MSKICCVGDADISPTSSCSMILRSACSHKHSHETSTVKEHSRVRKYSKRKRTANTKSDSLNSDLYQESSLQSSLKQLALKSARETLSLLKESLYNSLEVSEKVNQNIYKRNALNVSCAKDIHFSQLSTSNNSSFNLNGIYKKIECSSDYSSASEYNNTSSELSNSTSSMDRRYTRTSGSVRSVSGSDDESGISLQRIVRSRRNISDIASDVNHTGGTVLSQREANSHHVLNNYSTSHINANSHIGRYTATSLESDRLADSSNNFHFTESSHLDKPSVQYSSFDRFRWLLWRFTYLKIIKSFNFDVWFLSRFNRNGSKKLMFILMLPLLLLFFWGLIQSIAFSHITPVDALKSICTSLIMFLSSVFSSFSNCSAQMEKNTLVMNDAPSVLVPSTILSYIPSFPKIFSIFSNSLQTDDESASTTSEATYPEETHMLKFKSSIEGATNEEEIRLLVMKIMKDSDLFQTFNGQRTQRDMVEREKKLQNEIKNLKLEFQSFSETVKRIEEIIMKQNERNEATENIIALTDEQKRHIDHLNFKLKTIETKLGLLESIKSCCDKQLRPEDIALIVEKYVFTAFQNIVDGDADSNSKYYFLNEWLNSKFNNHERLLQKMNAALKEQSSYQANMMKSDIMIKTIESTVHKYVDSIKRDLTEKKESSFFSFGGGFSEDKIKKIVREAILLYDADKIGQVDYALESGGGSVLSTRCSETYVEKYGKLSIFGVPLWSNSNSPRTAIQPDVHPGRCWAFKGSQGFLLIELSATIYPTGFTLEHIPVSLSPTGSIDSAPKNFSVWGLETEKDNKGTLLGEYWYDINGEPLQYFSIEKPSEKPYSYVELQVHSNHGNMEYTCLYRFRVHGQRVR